MKGATSIELLGCPLDRLTMDQAVDRCMQWIRTGKRAQHVITVNAAILVMMQENPDLRRAIESAEIVVSDGASLVWASRLLRLPLPERVTGVDLMARLLHEAGRHRLRVFFLGAQEQVVRRLVERTEQGYPGAVVAGYRNGFFSPDERQSVIRQIRESRVDILFVGMPTPFKEIWCHEHLTELQVSVTLGVGGSFDVLAGFVRRAPQFMQTYGLEWAWRVMMEPRRLWKRYLVTNTRFILMVCSELLWNKPRRPIAAASREQR